MMLSRYPRILAVALILVLAFASPLAAHDPVFLSEEHTSPEVGPLLPDGTISFALYGRLLAADSTQAFQAGFNEGEALDLSLLIPAAFPETSFEVGSLPEIEVKRPDGSTFRLEPAFRQLFHEPYTNTRYLRLADYKEPAQQGIYSFIISGARAGRYVASIGTLERFGTEIIRYTRPLIVGRTAQPINQWFKDAVATDTSPDSAVTDKAADFDQELEAQEKSLSLESSGEGLLGEEAQKDRAPAMSNDPTDRESSNGAYLFVFISAAMVIGIVFVLRKLRR